MIAILRTNNPEHALRNSKTIEINLATEELRILDKKFPSPMRKVYLDIV